MLQDMAANSELLLFTWDDDVETLVEQLNLNQLDPAIKLIIAPTQKGDEVLDSCLRRIPSQTVIGCIVVISRSVTWQSTFEKVVRACVAPVAQRRDYRLFVHLSEITLEEFFDACKSNKALSLLRETVHLSSSLVKYDVQILRNALQKYLSEWDAIQGYLKYKKYEKAGIILGALLNIIIFIAVISAVGYTIYRGKQVAAAVNSEWSPLFFAIIGVIIFESVVAFLSMGSAVTFVQVELFVALASPLILSWFLPQDWIVSHVPFLILGFGLGLLLKIVRRKWMQYDRRQSPISLALSKWKPRPFQEPEHLMLMSALSLLGDEPRAFISYARSSKWGQAVAIELQRELQLVGIPSFLDIENIAMGSSWRHKLQDELQTATIFISLLDKLTVSHEWPAAEIATAYARQRADALPQLIIIRHPELVEQPMPEDIQPFFNSLLGPYTRMSADFLRIIDCQSDTAHFLALGLSNYRVTSIIKFEWRELIRIFGHPLQIILSTLGTLGTAAGWLIPLAWWGLSLYDKVIAPNTNAAVALLIAFWLGFVVRLAITSRFEFQHASSQTLTWMQIVAASGLISVLISLMQGLEALPGFLIVCGIGFGFLLASEFYVAQVLKSMRRLRDKPAI